MKFSDYIRSALMPAAQPAAMKLPGHTLYGDSIMNGGIADRLKARGLLIHDFSQPGDTAGNAWRRFAYDLRSMKNVIIQHGTNDLTAGINPVPFIRRMAEHALSEGRYVMLTGITFRTAPSKYSWVQANHDLRVLANDLDLDYVGWDMVDFSSDDMLHPDAKMADKMADLLHSRIVEAGQKDL